MDSPPTTDTNEQIIHVLPDNLANKIAAGEVVQRPASVVKELVENAIDAGAGEITVFVKRAGRELIQVSDDGCGMGIEDAQTCFTRHATSKIQTIEDLGRILTLGFRGEALASIAAVSQVELRTKRVEDSTGTLVRINGGNTESVEPGAIAPGTSISVKNLFFNVPARRNFLKSPATEFRHIVDTFQFLALSNPDIGFTLIHDDRDVQTLPKRDRGPAGLQRRVADLFSREPEQLVEVRDEASYLSVRGFVGKPAFTRKTRGEQYLFVNNRYVKSARLDKAVMLGYGEMLPHRSYPFFVLFLQLDPAHVDVNVHPTKTEVQFDDESGVFGFLRGAVRKGLGAVDIMPAVVFGDNQRLEEQVPGRSRTLDTYMPSSSRGSSKRVEGWHPQRLPSEHRPELFNRDVGKESDDLYSGLTRPTAPLPAVGQTLPEALEDLRGGGFSRRTWQLLDKYILVETDFGFVMMDQHAAHERVLYERFRKAIRERAGTSQQVLFPSTLDFSPGDFAVIEELLPEIKAIGFDVEILSGRTVSINGVPADLPEVPPEKMLGDLLEQFKSFRVGTDLPDRDNLAASMACRNAIKTGKTLASGEIDTLLKQLFDCEMPYACPHGRPTMIKISVEELDRRFGRTGHLER